ncbi:MAG TPA: hypothetical protein VNI02_07740 [Blastocatellia bacterium]|jgi:hypothetical protein|nr:hypothetical protein [Blastocatellia bacterium]
MILEHMDRRVLGAVSFIDATTNLRILSPLSVKAEGVKLTRNRRGFYVIATAPGLETYSETFREQPALVALGSVEVALDVIDPGMQYLPRRRVIRLPRDPSPANAGREDSLFRPVDVPLFPSPASATLPGWGLIRATIRERGTGNLLPWSLIRVTRNDNPPAPPRVLAVGLADSRGEALVPVPGIPITTWGETPEAVVATDIDVTLEVVFDPEVKKIADADALAAGADPNAGYMPDPDVLRQRPASASLGIRLASGQTRVETLFLNLA